MTSSHGLWDAPGAPTPHPLPRLCSIPSTAILGEHVVLRGGPPGKGGDAVVFSSELKDGMRLGTLGRQSIVVHGAATSGWSISNADDSSKARIIKADIKAGNGVYHLIDTVIMPVAGITPGQPCNKQIGPCRTKDQCRIPASAFPSTCSPSTVPTASAQGGSGVFR